MTEGLVFAVNMAILISLAILVGMVPLTFIGLRKRSKSTMLALAFVVPGAVLSGIMEQPWPLLGAMAVGFLIGLSIFTQDRVPFFQERWFSVTIRVTSVVTIILSIGLIAQSVSLFARHGVEDLSAVLLFLLFPLVAAILGLMWGSR